MPKAKRRSFKFWKTMRSSFISSEPAWSQPGMSCSAGKITRQFMLRCQAVAADASVGRGIREGCAGGSVRLRAVQLRGARGLCARCARGVRQACGRRAGGVREVCTRCAAGVREVVCACGAAAWCAGGCARGVREVRSRCAGCAARKWSGIPMQAACSVLSLTNLKVRRRLSFSF